MTRPITNVKTDFLIVHGSRGYGLNKPDSDWDFRGFFLPEARHVLGFIDGPEQSMQKTDEIDATSYDIRKFFNLASGCNPNVVETLFGDPADQVVTSPAAKIVLMNRHLFLSKKARYAFGGYAVGQLRKVRAGTWDDAAVRKDAMHMMRLLDFGTQILRNSDLNIRVKNPDYMRDIRAGKVTREEVLLNADSLIQRMDDLVTDSDLPESPDVTKLNEILIEIIREFVL